MSRLTISSLLDSVQAFQAPAGDITIAVPGERTVQVPVTTAQLESLQPQLDYAKAYGRVAWSVVDDGPTSAQLAYYVGPNGDTVPLVLGMPITCVGGQLMRANAGSQAHARVVGLVIIAADITLLARVQVAGNVTLGPLTWADIVEEPGGLIPSALYWLSTTPGKITATPPTALGTLVAPLGMAMSPLVFSLNLSFNVLQ